jgi:multisubunit Na+/H+ antiporter MnhB subunit
LIRIVPKAVTVVLFYLFYRPPDFRQIHGARSYYTELKRVDWLGLFLLVAGLTLFLLGVSWGG